MFGDRVRGKSRKYLASQTFTASYPTLDKSDRFFGNVLCTNQAAFTLAIMCVVDLILFFLDTFLWYIIWNTVFSIGRSFVLGLSIWTPWKDIYAQLPKRIYAKLLTTKDMEVKYKPKVKFVSNVMCRLFIDI